VGAACPDDWCAAADAMKELQTNQPQTNQPDPAQLLNKWLDSTKKVVVAPATNTSGGGKKKSNN